MTSSMIVNCPNCAEKMSVPADYAGLAGHCPKCKKPFFIGESEKPQVPTVQPPAAPITPIAPNPPSKLQNLLRAGWICFSIGMVLLVLCPIIPFFYSPFFSVSCVLSIILLAKDEGKGGLTLLLTTLMVPVVVGIVIFLLGVGATLAAFSGFVKELEKTENSVNATIAGTPSQPAQLQSPAFQPPTQQRKPVPQFVFQPPATQVKQPPAAPVTQPAAKPLPTREVTYDGLLKVLNMYADEYNRASTTVQRMDVRARAQKEVAVFVDDARMTLEGKVRDVQFGDDGKADLLFSDFAAPGSAVQANRNLRASSFGKLPVPITRDDALAIKPGQKVTITGRPFVVARDNFVVTMLDEAANPSLITFKFLYDIESFLTLRMRNYVVSFEDKQTQAAPAAPRVNKPYSLIVVPPKASP